MILSLSCKGSSSTLSNLEIGAVNLEFSLLVSSKTSANYSYRFLGELIRAYPAAKVIVNKREDVEAWYQSLLNTFGVSSPFGSWSIALFDCELFWLKAGRDAVWSHMVGYDFARTGRYVYRDHYARIDEGLESEKAAASERKALRWNVEDGWEGLLEILDNKLPIDRETGLAVEFPRGNNVPEFHRRRMAATMERVKKAKRRRTVLIIIVVAAVLRWLLRLSLY